jgi:hypothetical protein
MKRAPVWRYWSPAMPKTGSNNFLISTKRSSPALEYDDDTAWKTFSVQKAIPNVTFPLNMIHSVIVVFVILVFRV